MLHIWATVSELTTKRGVMDDHEKCDSVFLSAIFILADEWGVKITNIDLENRILDFDCKWELRHPFVKKLNELFGGYLE